MPTVESWLYPTPSGLFCEPGGFYIDPPRAVDRAIITHGHADHARSGHGAVLATSETIAIMKVRYGANCAGHFDDSVYGHETSINDVRVRLTPAGHILGSAQVTLEHAGKRAVISGDYKRATDPTCAGYELIACDVFVTEATFALPVFRHERAEAEALRLIQSLARYPERAHLLGVYGLGKCQRMIKLLRNQGYDAPIYLHGALVKLCELYQSLGIELGDVRPASSVDSKTLDSKAVGGALFLCPPSSLQDRWAARFPDPVTVFASGWMRVRGRSRQRGVELPLIVSDHADWPELLDTIVETGAEDVWVTHGRDDALVHQLASMGRRARALSLVGYEDEAE